VISPYELIADIINRRPFAVAAAFIVVFFIAFAGMGMMTMQTGSDTYLDKDTTRGMLLNKYMDTFSSDAVMLVYESDNVISPATIAYIDRLQQDIVNEQYVTGASSIADQMRSANGGTLPTSIAEITAAKEQVPPEMLERILPSNMMTIGVVSLEPGISAEVKTQILNNIESIIRISDPPPGLKVFVTGDAAFNKQMEEEMGTSMGVLIGAAMLLMILAVGVFFSHVSYRFLPVLVVASGLIMTFGVMGIVGIPISMIVIGAFPVMIGIGIDYAIQFQSRFDEETKLHPIPVAVKNTIVNSGPSILFAMIATSLGFFAMYVAPVPMMRDFGLICIIGCTFCYLAALIMVPTFGILIKYRPKSENGASAGGHMEAYDRALGSLAGKIARNPVPVILILGFVAVVGLQLDNSIPISADEEAFVPPDMPAVIDLNKVRRTMGSTDSVPIYVRGEGVLNLETLQWMKDFQDYELANNDKVTSAASIVTYIIQYNGGMMPTTDREVADAMDRIPESVKKQYVSGNMEAIISFGLVNMESEVALALVDRINSDLAWNSPPPGIVATPTGMLEMFANLMKDIASAKFLMTLLGFGLILTFLIVVYRQLSAISPIIPIIFIVGWNSAIMYLLHIDYNPMTATLGSMTIGVASEYTILIMERYKEEIHRGLDMFEAIRQSVQKIGTAITVSGLTTVLGFSALILSTFNIIKNFGTVTVITVGFSLCGAIIVMPAVLSLMGRFSGEARLNTDSSDASVLEG